MIENAAKLNLSKIGDRIEYQGYFGTIKYIGEVNNYKGLWLGIDWDDPSRGKHNGNVNGTQYFTANSEISGSFVKYDKVQVGHSIIKAITTRYGNQDDELTNKINQQQMLIAQRLMKAPLLELIGFDKVANQQSNYDNLLVVNARLQNVKYIGEPFELKNLCPNIVELDISKNLINSWSYVFQICSELENLEWINISENILSVPENLCQENFPNLKTLICGTMMLTWENLIKFSHFFPNLEEIVAPNNIIKNIDISNNDLQKLKSLDLENNEIGWKEACKLGMLPQLESLNLERTGITKIQFEDEKTELFKNLRHLVLKDNLINDWQSIGELNKLEKLESLKCIKNPLLEQETNATSTQLIIARIGSLHMLNGTDVRGERKGAEYDYIKKYGLEWLSLKNDDEKLHDFLLQHNRYTELINMYGELEESELAVQAKTIQVSLIEVKLIYEDAIIVKKLPPSILIQKLIMLAQRLFRLQDRPSLVYVSCEHPDIEIDLNDECKELGIYSIQNGDRILIKT